MSVTMKDIAEMANVSQAAVSLAINNKQSTRVSEKKRREIMDLARKFGYTPSISAQHLRGKKTNIIGIIGGISDIPVHRGLIMRLTKLLRQKGYHSMLAQPYRSPQEDAEVIRQFTAHGVDAILYVSPREIFTKPTVPYIRVDTDTSCEISIDKEYGGYEITKHLIQEHGHKKIAFLTFIPEGSLRRHHGYSRALAEAGLACDPELFISTRNNFDAEATILDLITAGKATAFFCSNDYLAAQLISFLQRNGINVPDEIAVVGFDGLKLTELFSPSITTVIQPMSELADQCVEMLMRKLHKNSASIEKKLIKPQLRIAESCGCVNKNAPTPFADFRAYETIEACARLREEERARNE